MNKQLGLRAAAMALEIAQSVQLSWERTSQQLESWSKVAVKAAQECVCRCLLLFINSKNPRFKAI